MADMNISNGTCYSGQQTETNGDFIPCGNIALGNWPCCKAGDVCLGFETANACYDYNSTNTYIAGCTDATYGDSTCPQKAGFDKQEWVAIQHCGTSSSGDTNWGGCKNVPVNDTALTKLPNSRCDPFCASTTLWVGASTIEAYATVPTAAGGSITWTNDFNPAATSRPAGTLGTGITTTTSSSPSTTSSATPTSTSPSDSSNDDSGLDTGAKIGIGIGSAGAALLIITIILLALLVRRRKKKRTQQNLQDGQEPTRPGTSPGGTPHYAGNGWAAYDPHKQSPPPFFNAAAQGYGHMGQVPGQQHHHHHPDMSYTGVHLKHELPASNGHGHGHGQGLSPSLSTASPDYASVSNASTLLPGHQGGGSGFHVSPQSTGTNGGGFVASYGGGRGHAGSVSEMQG